MKTFSDLLAIKDICLIQVRAEATGGTLWVNGVAFGSEMMVRWDQPIEVVATAEITSLEIGGHEVLPKWKHLTSVIDGEWRFSVSEPFFRWFHHQSGQGWLFLPAPDSDC
jgi:hypothetical protein